jgi:hypothetical protein
MMAQKRQALRLLADAPHGRSVADMLAHGCTNLLLDKLTGDGLATIQPATMRTGTRRVTIVWVEITEAGRQAIVDPAQAQGRRAQPWRQA